MILRGVYLLKKNSGNKVEEFSIPNGSLNGSILAKVYLKKLFGYNYILSTNAIYNLDENKIDFKIRKIKIFYLYLYSIYTIFIRFKYAYVKLFIKAILKVRNDYLADILREAWLVKEVKNDGNKINNVVKFDFGEQFKIYSEIINIQNFSQNKIVLYAHFDKNSKDISDIDLKNLKILNENNFDIILISTTLGDVGVRKLSFVQSIIIKDNYGYDFFSWKIGLEIFHDKIKAAKYLIFTNNSIEITDSKIFKLIDEKNAPVCGITESLQCKRHIESYWWQINLNLVELDIVKKYFDEVKALPDKQRVVHYEIDFTEYMEKNHIKSTSLYRYMDLLSYVCINRNKYINIYSKLKKDWRINPSKAMYFALKNMRAGILKKYQNTINGI